jgi:transcriptional regulator with XRE-family HTH domain
VTIGATLAAARRRAGLSVGEVSQRTRVTENVIQDIEHDDYAACGGDFYARGHIRAIAGAVDTDPSPLIEEFDETWGAAPEITAAEAFQPAMPVRTRERRRVRWTSALAVLVLAVLGFAIYKAGSGSGPARGASADPGQPAGGQVASGPAGQAGAQGSTAPAGPTQAASAGPSVTPSVSASPSPVTVQVLPVAKVSAFGPGGGDGAGQAALAVSGNPATPWRTDWYATPDFGKLYTGTGLLVDMGHPVTVTSVRLSLGIPSASLELRAGDRPVAAVLRTVAASAGAGRTAELTLTSPAQARYLLIWFTKLPPDGAGTYQASIYQIVVRGPR